MWRNSYESSWGPFEFIDMCNAAGIEPIITTAAESNANGKAKPGAGESHINVVTLDSRVVVRDVASDLFMLTDVRASNLMA